MQKELSILKQISLITKGGFNLHSVLEKFLDNAMEATGAEAGSILLLDHATSTLSFAAALGEKAGMLKNYKLALGEGIAGWVAQEGKPVITPDASKDERFDPKISRNIKYKTRNMICAPLEFEGDVMGVIEILNRKDGKAFDKHDLALLNNYLPYISALVKNARLMDENRARIHRLEHLMEVTSIVNSTLKLEELLDMVLEISTELLHAEAGSVLLLDEKNNELVFSAMSGENEKTEKLKDVRVPVGQGIAGWVAEKGEPLLVADAQSDPRFYRMADKKTQFVTRSIIAVPLKLKDGKVIGVVEILNKKDGCLFNDEDKNLLMSLANQAAVAFENAKLYGDLQELFLNTVKSLANAIEAKDPYTRGHSERVTFFSVLIARKLGLSSEEIEKVRLAALLHDIGKIGVDEAILRKPARLTEQEFSEVKKHPDFAADILMAIPQLAGIIPAIRHHHERYDGMGYPSGMVSKSIPELSRIIAVADTFDAMSSTRPYRDAVPPGICIEEIKRCAGTQFDPDVAQKAVAALNEYFENEGRKAKKAE